MKKLRKILELPLDERPTAPDLEDCKTDPFVFGDEALSGVRAVVPYRRFWIWVRRWLGVRFARLAAWLIP